MSRPHVAFVTSEALRDLWSDDLGARAALEARGVSVTPTVWTDESIDWTAFDLVVLRSPWDWYQNGTAFRAWLEALEARGVKLENRGAARFLEKTYLRDAATRGANVIPTEWIEPGERRPLAEIVRATGWERAVFKPSLSANAHRTVLFDAAERTHGLVLDGLEVYAQGDDVLVAASSALGLRVFRSHDEGATFR